MERRKYLQTVGSIAASGIVTSGIGSANNNHKTDRKLTTLREIGLENKTKKLLKRNDIEALQKLLLSNDVKFGTVERGFQVNDDGSRTNEIYEEEIDYTSAEEDVESEITPDFWSRSSSSVNMAYAWLDESECVISASWDMEVSWSQHTFGPEDRVAITFSDSLWQPVERSSDNFTKRKNSDFDPDEIQYDQYKRYGVVATNAYEDVSSFPHSDSGTITTDIDQINDVSSQPIGFDYNHNYYQYGVPSWINVSFGVGGISVSGGPSIGHWIEDTSIDPGTSPLPL